MVKIGTVWESAVEAVRGRAGMILPIAALAIFLPAVTQAGLAAYSPPTTPGVALTNGLLSMALGVLGIWGGLAIMAIVSHPNTTTADATKLATARLLPAIGVALALVALLGLLLLPILAVLAASGVDFATLGRAGGGGARPLAGGSATFVVVYGLVMLGLILWLGARLMLLNPVILHERIGLRAVRRSFELTRGMAGRLLGALLLFLVVLLVATSAAQLVVGLLARLALGADGVATATFLAAVVGAIVSTVFTVLAYAFVARLYAMLSGSHLAAIFEDAPAH